MNPTIFTSKGISCSRQTFPLLFPVWSGFSFEDAGSPAFTAGLSGPLINSGSIAAKTHSRVFLRVRSPEETTTALALSDTLAILVIIIGLIPIPKEAGVLFLTVVRTFPLGRGRVSTFPPQKSFFDVAGGELLSVTCHPHIRAIRKAPLSPGILLGSAGTVIVNSI